jgi:hypothetical protein
VTPGIKTKTGSSKKPGIFPEPKPKPGFFSQNVLIFWQKILINHNWNTEKAVALHVQEIIGYVSGNKFQLTSKTSFLIQLKKAE